MAKDFGRDDAYRWLAAHYAIDPGLGDDRSVACEYTTPWFSFPAADPPIAAPAAVCEHPAALLKLADALATCDGCGRVFELKDFGK